jgi:hypothetical protein
MIKNRTNRTGQFFLLESHLKHAPLANLPVEENSFAKGPLAK